MNQRQPEMENGLEERVISVDRISRTVKGGRRIRFRALVVIGDKQGKVGIGMEKGADVQSAIAKAKARAQKEMITVVIKDGSIAHPVEAEFGTTKVIFKPAREGHSIIAGGAVRPVLEMVGVRNIVSKSLGSTNKYNSAMAAFNALGSLK